MKNIYITLFVALSILSIHCQQEINIDLNDTGTGPAPITATLQGNVLDENDQPLMGVTIKVGVKSVTTDSRGYFRIVGASLDKNLSLVTAEMIGYFKAYRTFCATSGVNQVMIKMIPEVLVGTVNSANGGEVTLANGAKINLAANSIMKASGGSYSGTINIYAASIDPTAADITLAIPGSFIGENSARARGLLTSYGMVAVELRSATGEKLQVAAGSTATLTMPIPSSMLGTAPSSIALWYIDEQTGIWKEEGSATKNGNVYIGQVKHFSFWNCDAFNNAIILSMTLRNNENLPYAYARVKLTRPNSNFSYGWTDSLGQVSGYIPPNEVLAMEVLAPYPCSNVIYSQNIGPFTQNTNLGVITVNNNSSSSIITVTGRLLNCSNNPVANGFAIINYDNIVRYASVNSTGNFSTTLITCSGGPANCWIIGVDNGAQQQGAMVTVNLVAPVTNAGDIAACGTSTLQYVNFNLDGTNYSISSGTPGDSLVSYTIDSLSSITTIISAFRPSGGNISFSYTATTAVPGTYPFNYLTVQNMSAQLIQPFNAVVTNFATSPGGFHEGSFSGQFIDAQNPGPTHTITGSFRIRK